MAWRVEYTDSDEVWAYILADSEEEATRIAREDDEFDPEGGPYEVEHALTARRVPELDGERITHRQLFEAGRMWVQCFGCGAILHSDTTDEWGFEIVPPTPIWENAATPYCNDECTRRLRPGRLTHRNYPSEKCVVLYASY